MENTTKINAPDNGTTAPSIVLQIYQKLGRRSKIARKVVERMAAAGQEVSINSVYNVIYSRTTRPDITAVFLDVAEEMLATEKQLQDRATQLAS